MRKSASNVTFYDRRPVRAEQARPLQERKDALGRHAGDRDALLASVLPADDSDSAPRHAEASGEELDQRVVGRTLDRRRGEAHEERAVTRSGNLGFSGSRDHPDGENDAVRTVDAKCGMQDAEC